jgi:TRAP-type C4-dicarboxylate transport system permease small subunit
MVSLFRALVRFVDRLLRAVISTMIGVMLAVIVLQVFCRYGLNAALSWPEELSRYLQIWVGLLAAIYAYHEGSHVGVTFLLDKLPKTLVKVIVAVSHALMGVFLCVIGWQGAGLLEKFVDLRSAAVRIPMVLIYAAVPVSAFLMLLVCVKLIYVTLVGETNKG